MSDDPQDMHFVKFNEGYDEAMRQGVGGEESIQWVTEHVEPIVRTWIETAVKTEKAGTSDKIVHQTLDQLMSLHLDYVGVVAREVALDITAEAVDFAEALGDEGVEEVDAQASEELTQLRGLKDKLFEQMDRALFIEEGAVERWSRLQDGFLRTNDMARMIDSLLDERDALRKGIEEVQVSGHTCPPGKLVRVFDGGRQAMLCPTCDVILGYDA